MTTMMAAPSDVFDNWAQVYDEQPNPLLSLEQRFLTRMLPDAAGLDVLDAGCGTGRWLQHLAVHHPASLIGVDSSAPDACSMPLPNLEPQPHCVSEVVSLCPSQNATADWFWPLSSSAILKTLRSFAREIHRVTRPGATVFLTDMHPDTAISCNWKRSFKVRGMEEHLETYRRSIEEIIETFRACGFESLARIEPAFDSQEKATFEQNGKLDSFHASANLPAIYILQLRKQSAPPVRSHQYSESSENVEYQWSKLRSRP